MISHYVRVSKISKVSLIDSSLCIPLSPLSQSEHHDKQSLHCLTYVKSFSLLVVCIAQQVKLDGRASHLLLRSDTFPSHLLPQVSSLQSEIHQLLFLFPSNLVILFDPGHADTHHLHFFLFFSLPYHVNTSGRHLLPLFLIHLAFTTPYHPNAILWSHRSLF